MGGISAEFADVTIITAEDPRNESVEAINNMIEEGYRNSGNGKQLIRINNRQEAIATAIRMAHSGDLVLITGKGHEESMNFGKGEEHWSDHEAVKNALNSLQSNQ